MSVVTSGNFAKLLWPGIESIYGDKYKEHSKQWPLIFEERNSDKYREEIQGVTGLGLIPIKAEGEAITYDTMEQGFTDTFTHVTYAGGFIITREMYEDNQYSQVMLNRATALAFSVNQTAETVAANILNRAFNGDYTYGDGKELCATNHPNKTGGTWQNELTTAADLSEASLEQACNDVAGFTNDRGLYISVTPKKLLIPRQLVFEATRILKSQLQPDSAENNINALRTLGSIPEIITNNYLSDTDAWFILTDCPNGLICFKRRAEEFKTEDDWDTENAKFKASFRRAWGCADKHSLYASPGA